MAKASFITDKRHLKQIIRNIITNTIKYSEGEILVSVEVEINKGFINFYIKDNGKGIEKEKIDFLTGPFKQEEKDPYIADKGWGLGLAVVHSLVTLHNGSIKFESELNKGTRVGVRIPEGTV